MANQRKIKLLIALAIIILIALFALITTQLIFIGKTNKELRTQQKEIEELNRKLDYYENKLPDNGYDIEY